MNPDHAGTEDLFKDIKSKKIIKCHHISHIDEMMMAFYYSPIFICKNLSILGYYLTVL